MPRIGASNLTVAKMLSDDVNGVTYGAPVAFTKKLMKIVYDIAVGRAMLEADDQVVDTTTNTGEVKVNIDVTDLTLSEKALLLGQTISNGVRVVNKDDSAPYFCVMFKAKKSNGKYRFVKLLKVQFQEPKGDFETEKSTPNYQTETLEGVGIDRLYDGNKMREADEDEVTYAGIGTTWFDSGDITVDIVAPTLSSTTPAANATAVAVGTTVDFVFSEAILPSCVNASNFFVVKDTDGSAVAGTLSQSGDKKTITFTPTSALTAATAYRIVATTGVKDLSNNAMATLAMRKFTTA